MQLIENIARVLTGKLNTVDDAAIGASMASPSGSIVPSYPGQLGKSIGVSGAEATRLSTTALPLYGGIYQYVKFKAASSASNAKGQLVFWETPASHVVTPDAAAANLGLLAGVTLNAVTKGQYGWIQTGGRATVKFKASITKATPAAADLVIVDQAPTNTGDILADATGLTSLTARSIVGVVESAPTGGGYAIVHLWTRFWNMG